ncbi:MAG TPA: transglutaminase-like domain-containing protein [Terriglobales bacterium]|nr:transglutaminase-like domain-containing protein [Terriglobales bacterium]
MRYDSQNSLAETFAALVGPEIADENVDLLRAALTIARTEYPDLDCDAYVARVDELARTAEARISEIGDAGQTIAALNHVLFTEAGLRGNRENYYDPRNSFLNDVLDRRLGIPITLAVLYMEVGRRLGFPLFGVGMPGHFLLKHYDIDGKETLIDCFNGGDILSAQDCQQRLDEIYSGQMTLRPEFLFAVSRRQILTRILNNLKTIYMAARNFRKTLPLIDLVLVIYPRSPEDVKQRATLRYSLGQNKGAAEDLESYLKMSPDASDADEIRQTALSIRRMLALMN